MENFYGSRPFLNLFVWLVMLVMAVPVFGQNTVITPDFDLTGGCSLEYLGQEIEVTPYPLFGDNVSSRGAGNTWVVTQGYGTGCDEDDCTITAPPSQACDNNTGVYQVPVKITIFQDDDGSNPGATDIEAAQQIQYLNDYFVCEGVPISFYQVAGSPFRINDTDLNAFRDGDPTDDDDYAESNLDVQSNFNIYIANSVNGSTGCNGYAYLPTGVGAPNRMAISGNCMSTIVDVCANTGSATVMIHEVGHWLGLYHTHADYEVVRNSSGVQTGNTGSRQELPDGSNSCTTGDRIGDTDADPNLSDQCAVRTGCNIDVSACLDPTGTAGNYDVSTVQSNIMSYNNLSGCRQDLSDCQKAKMVDALLCARRDLCDYDLTRYFTSADDASLSICEGDAIPTFNASVRSCIKWFDAETGGNQIGTGATFSPTSAQAGTGAVGTYEYWIEENNEFAVCRKKVTLEIVAKVTDTRINGSATYQLQGNETINLTSTSSLEDGELVGWLFTSSAVNPTDQASLNTILTSATVGTTIAAGGPNNIIKSTSGTPLTNLSLPVSCDDLGGGTYYFTPLISSDDVAAPSAFTNTLTGQSNISSTVNTLNVEVSQLPANATLTEVCIVVDWSCEFFATNNDLEFALRAPNGATITLEDFLPGSTNGTPSSNFGLDFCFVDDGTGFVADNGCNASCLAGKVESDISFASSDGTPNGTWQFILTDDFNPTFYPCEISVDLKFDQNASPTTFPTVDFNACTIGDAVTLVCSNCVPTITNPSAAQTICETSDPANFTVSTSETDVNGISFVYFTAQQTGTAMYTGGTLIESVTPSAGTATLLGTDAQLPTAAGTYYIYAIANPTPADALCRQFQEIVLTIEDNLSPGVAGSAEAICLGSTTAIDLFSLIAGEDTGGVWTRTTGTGGTLSGSTFTPDGSTTNSTFTYTVNESTSCTDATSLVTVNVFTPPTAEAGTLPDICESASPTAITLSNGSMGGGSLRGAWSIVTGNGSLSSVAQSGDPFILTYTPQANFSGTATLRLTTSGDNSCSTATDDVSFTINALPATPTATATVQPSCPTPTGTIEVTAPTTDVEYSVGGAYQGSATFSGLTPSTYSITARNTTTGCVSSAASVVINAIPNQPDPPTTGGAVSACEGATIPDVTATVPGATEVIDWYAAATGGTALTSVNTNHASGKTTAGTYTYYAETRDSSTGCVSATRTPVSLTIHPAVAVLVADASACAGSSASLTAIPSSGTAPYTYSWSGGGETTAGVTRTTAGSYTVTVTDDNGCIASDGGLVTIDPLVVIEAGGPNTVCQSASPSAITLSGASVSGGASTGVWSITSGGGALSSTAQTTTPTTVTYTPAANASGTITLTLTSNATGACSSDTDTRTITINPLPTITAVATNPTTCGGTDGQLALTLTNVANGTYTVGYHDGTTALTFTGVSVSSGAATITGLSAGTYNDLSITNENSCVSSNDEDETLSDPTAPVISSVTENDPTTCAGSDGSLVLTGLTAGTTYNYSYSKDGAAATGSAAATAAGLTISGLGQGTYTAITVTDATTNCTSAATTGTLTDPGAPTTPTVSTNSPVCAGETINLTTATVAGATYAWSGPGAFTSNLEDPSIGSSTVAMAGTYSLTVTVAGCTSTAGSTTVVVNPVPAITSVTENDPTTCGGTGSLVLTGLSNSTTYRISYQKDGGTAVVQNLTSNGSGEVTISPLTAGAFTNITATLNNCASIATTATLSDPGAPTAPTGVTSNTPVCVGTAINLSADAVTNATYNWTGPNGFTSDDQNPTISSAAEVNEGTYSLTVTVAGCTSTSSTTSVVVNPLPVISSVTENDPTTCAGSDGSLVLTGLTAGTTYNYSYSKDGAAATGSAAATAAGLTISGLGQGTYSAITVTDATTNCTSAATTGTLTDPGAPTTPTVSTNSPVCAGETINLTTATVAGATYAWSGPGAFTSNLEDPSIGSSTVAMAGTYSLTVTVAGCTSTAGSTTVVVNPVPAITSVTENDPTTCGGNGSLVLTGLSNSTTYSISYQKDGGTAVVQNLTSNGSGEVTISPLTAGAFTNITATLNNCASIATTATLSDPGAPAAPTGVTSNTPVCVGAAINLSANAVTNATYNWTGPNGFTSDDQNPTISSAAEVNEGTYSLTVTVAGCTSTSSTTSVVVNPLPVISSVTENDPTTCAGSDGSLVLTGLTAGTTYNYSYSKDGAAATTGSAAATAAGLTISGLSSGAYTNIIVTTAVNCSSTASTANLSDPGAPASSVASSNGPVCVGETVNLSASEVIGATYAWSGPNGYSSALQNPTFAATATSQGTYTVVATVAGCQGSGGTVNLTVNPIPTYTATGNNPTSCSGFDGSLTIEGLNGSTSYLVTYDDDGTPKAPATLTSTAGGQIVLSNLGEAVYSNIILTLNGCSGLARSATLTGPANCGGVSVSTTDTSGGAATDGTATVAPTFGTGPYDFVWSNPVIGNTGTPTDLAPGTYTVTVTDNVGASVVATVVISGAPAVTVLDSNGDGIPDITDPCSCDDPLNILNAEGTDTDYFHDIITITSNSGEDWFLNTGTIYSSSATVLAGGGTTTRVTETSPGVYTLDIWHPVETGYTAEFINGSGEILTISNACTSCLAPLAAIPTMSQWGLILFALLMLNLAFAAMAKIQVAKQTVNGKFVYEDSQPWLNSDESLKATVFVMLVALIAIMLFQGGFLWADLFGLPIASYLVYKLLGKV